MNVREEYENLTRWTILYLTDFSIEDLNEQIAKEEVIGYFDNCRDARRWLDRNAQKKRNDEIYDHYERFIYRDGKKLNYHFLEWSVSKEDKEKGLYEGKIIPKLL